MSESTEKKPRKLNDIQIIVIRLLPAMEKSFDHKKWAREGGLVKNLITEYGKPFMMWVKLPPNFKPDSLLSLKGAWGKKYLSEQMFEFKRIQAGIFAPREEPVEKAEIVLTPNKIGEDVVIERTKPKSLKDFLNYGKTNQLSKSRPIGQSVEILAGSTVEGNGGDPL
jgi:hypothetical protein